MSVRPQYFIILFLIGVFLRVTYMGSELWLDEILTLQIAQGEASLFERVFGFGSDNDHPLNTLLLSFISSETNWMVRLPAVLFGGVGVFLMISLFISHPQTQIVTLYSISLSPFLVYYSSEARGYALLLFFALLLPYLIVRVIDDFRWRDLFSVSLVTAFGLLSHATFLFVVCGALAWLATEYVFRRDSVLEVRQAVVFPFFSILLVSLLFVVLSISRIPVGAGPSYSTIEVIAAAIAAVFGGAEQTLFPALYYQLIGLLVILVSGSQLLALCRSRDPIAIFYIVAIFVAPLCALIVRKPEALFERYFTVSILYLTLLFAGATARWLLDSEGLRRFAQGLMLLFALHVLIVHALYLSSGRGDIAALLKIISEGSEERASVTSDHDLRLGTLVRFHSAAQGYKEIQYVSHDSEGLQSDPPKWLLRHDVNYLSRSLAKQYSFLGVHYERVALQRCAGYSCWNIGLYRRE